MNDETSTQYLNKRNNQALTVDSAEKDPSREQLFPPVLTNNDSYSTIRVEGRRSDFRGMRSSQDSKAAKKPMFYTQALLHKQEKPSISRQTLTLFQVEADKPIRKVDLQ